MWLASIHSVRLVEQFCRICPQHEMIRVRDDVDVSTPMISYTYCLRIFVQLLGSVQLHSLMEVIGFVPSNINGKCWPTTMISPSKDNSHTYISTYPTIGSADHVRRQDH